jgi:signal transduction histidine kinase
MMSSSVRKLDGFIKDITDYAKNKRQQLKIEPIDIKLVIENSLLELRFLPNGSRLAVNISIDQSVLYSDRARLEIVFKNILSNSFRYMDHSKEFSFLAIEGSVSSEGLRLKFEDNGIGIGKQHVNKIFEMFYRAVEHSQGTGIGLFLVKESVKILRGKIFVKSTLGAGSTFYLEIPHLKSDHVNIPEEQVVTGVENKMLV